MLESLAADIHYGIWSWMFSYSARASNLWSCDSHVTGSDSHVTGSDSHVTLLYVSTYAGMIIMTTVLMWPNSHVHGLQVSLVSKAIPPSTQWQESAILWWVWEEVGGGGKEEGREGGRGEEEKGMEAEGGEKLSPSSSSLTILCVLHAVQLG